MRDLFISVLLLSSGCMTQADDVAGNEEQLACTFERGGAAGDQGVEVCSLFRAEIAALGRDDIASLFVTEVSPRSARAVALGRGGEELLALDFDVMDARLDETTWAEFARSFARQLETGKN